MTRCWDQCACVWYRVPFWLKNPPGSVQNFNCFSFAFLSFGFRRSSEGHGWNVQSWTGRIKQPKTWQTEPMCNLAWPTGYDSDVQWGDSHFFAFAFARPSQRLRSYKGHGVTTLLYMATNQSGLGKTVHKISQKWTTRKLHLQHATISHCGRIQ